MPDVVDSSSFHPQLFQTVLQQKRYRCGGLCYVEVQRVMAASNPYIQFDGALCMGECCATYSVPPSLTYYQSSAKQGKSTYDLSSTPPKWGATAQNRRLIPQVRA
jgi:hypothetical protein